MVIVAKKLRRGDVLADGSTVAAIVRAEGQTKAKLADGRLLSAPDTYLLGVTRPKEAPEGHAGGDLWA